MTFRYYRKSKSVPSSVQDFLERTKPGSASVSQEMGQLKDADITEKQFFDFCTQFAGGVQYIYDTYKKGPEKIIFCDQLEDKTISDGAKPLAFDENNGTLAEYSPDKKHILISRAFCQDIIKVKRDYFADEDNDKYPITPEQYIFLLGVEEAYHHYQAYGGSRANRKGFITIDEAYNPNSPFDHPSEREARKVLLEAAKKLGMIGRGR